MKPTREQIERITKHLVAEGRLIEAGFEELKLMSISPQAPPLQVKEMRVSFFAGAQHLFGSIMSVLDPGVEPTENDLKRLTAIHLELQRFAVEFKKEHGLGQ